MSTRPYSLLRVILDLRLVQQKMSQKNDHRAVLHRCELALMALAKEQPEHSQAQEPPSAAPAA